MSICGFIEISSVADAISDSKLRLAHKQLTDTMRYEWVSVCVWEHNKNVKCFVAVSVSICTIRLTLHDGIFKTNSILFFISSKMLVHVVGRLKGFILGIFALFRRALCCFSRRRKRSNSGDCETLNSINVVPSSKKHHNEVSPITVWQMARLELNDFLSFHERYEL